MIKLAALLPLAVVWSVPALAQMPPRNQAAPAGSAGVAEHMKTLGYKDIHDLRRGPDGQWTGRATRNGVPTTVTSTPYGGTISR